MQANKALQLTNKSVVSLRYTLLLSSTELKRYNPIRKYMHKLRIIVLLIACFVSNAVLSESKSGLSAKPEGDLGLVIVASETPEYITEWLTTPSSHGITIKRLKTAQPDQLIVSAFLATGLSPDESGNFSFSVSYYFLDPNEKALFGQRDFAKGSGLLPKKSTFIMADPALDIILEDSDPEGTYTIVAQLKDLVSGKTANCSYDIRFVKNGL